MKIATWNVNSLNVRLGHTIDWLQSTQTDLLCLQETKTVDEKFPVEAFSQIGYRVQFVGQKTYNGVALVSKIATTPEPSHLTTVLPDFVDEQKRLIAANFGSLRVVCGYFPNGESLTSDKFIYKMNWLSALQAMLVADLRQNPNLVLLGDFNIAPTDADVHDPELWKGLLHCSDQERNRFNELLQLGLHDAFRLFEQAPRLFSWWDYRQLGFRRNAGLRIDHILVTDALRSKVRSVVIDKAPRKLEKPSDHTPVVMDLDWAF
jgi:exodeoxyribonuclease III